MPENEAYGTSPEEVREILRDSLTERGIDQWWTRPNRNLSGERPCDVWPRSQSSVVSAAHAFGEGYYT